MESFELNKKIEKSLRQNLKMFPKRGMSGSLKIFHILLQLQLAIVRAHPPLTREVFLLFIRNVIISVIIIISIVTIRIIIVIVRLILILKTDNLKITFLISLSSPS